MKSCKRQLDAVRQRRMATAADKKLRAGAAGSAGTATVAQLTTSHAARAAAAAQTGGRARATTPATGPAARLVTEPAAAASAVPHMLLDADTTAELERWLAGEVDALIPDALLFGAADAGGGGSECSLHAAFIEAMLDTPVV